MKKIYLFLALAIAVAINASAVNDNLRLHTWGNGVLDNLTNKVFTKVGDLWTIEFETPITLEQSEQFLVKDDNEVYLKTWKGQAARTVWAYSKDQNNSDRTESFELAAGTYYSVTIVKTDYADYVISFNSELAEDETYTFFTWGDLGSLNGKAFTRINGRESVYVFEQPLEVTSDHGFLLQRNGQYVRSPKHKDNAYTSWIGIIHNNDRMDNSDFTLKAGTYYSATIKDGVLKFNTYAKTTTGLDALLKKAADYVEIGSEIFVQAHHHNYYLAYTTESSTYVGPNADQDTKHYGDDPEKFAKRDWVGIYAPGETGLVGKNIAAGTIIEVATEKAVKWGTVGSEATSFTPNLYRPLNFSATETDKDVMYIFQPQEGEVLQVRGKFAKDGDYEHLTDNKAEHKVALLAFTASKMTVGEWYTLNGILHDGAVCYTGFETATGVESVETANATVFAANGTINVSGDAEASIEVYTANGQMVRAINADNASIAVAPGFYLVKVGNQVSKVVVK